MRPGSGHFDQSTSSRASARYRLIHTFGGKLDKNLLVMPTGGFGFSRNPVIAFSQPSYAATRFEAAAAIFKTIRMKYFL